MANTVTLVYRGRRKERTCVNNVCMHFHEPVCKCNVNLSYCFLSERYELYRMSKTKETISGKGENDDNNLTSLKTRHSPDKALALYIICIMSVTAAALASVFLF